MEGPGMQAPRHALLISRGYRNLWPSTILGVSGNFAFESTRGEISESVHVTLNKVAAVFILVFEVRPSSFLIPFRQWVLDSSCSCSPPQTARGGAVAKPVMTLRCHVYHNGRKVVMRNDWLPWNWESGFDLDLDLGLK